MFLKKNIGVKISLDCIWYIKNTQSESLEIQLAIKSKRHVSSSKQ